MVEEIDDSNMSKLGLDGEPIINDGQKDPTKPVGKILKGPNFRKPDIESVIMGCWDRECAQYGVPGHSHQQESLL